MNDNIPIEATLLSSTHPYISKHTNLLSIVISLVLIMAGVASVWFALSFDSASSTISMLLLTVGTICLLIALYRLFWRTKEKVYTQTGSAIVEGSCYWDSCDYQSLVEILEHANFKLGKNLTVKLSGNIRLDYIVSKDRRFAAVQLFRFVPYVYEPVTQVYYYMEDDAVGFVRYLMK